MSQAGCDQDIWCQVGTSGRSPSDLLDLEHQGDNWSSTTLTIKGIHVGNITSWDNFKEEWHKTNWSNDTQKLHQRNVDIYMGIVNSAITEDPIEIKIKDEMNVYWKELISNAIMPPLLSFQDQETGSFIPPQFIMWKNVIKVL